MAGGSSSKDKADKGSESNRKLLLEKQHSLNSGGQDKPLLERTRGRTSIAPTLTPKSPAANSSSFRARAQLSYARVINSPWFENYVLTLGFGLSLYAADTVSDVLNSLAYFNDGDVYWAYLTLGLVFVPGLVRGSYELCRRQIVYQSSSQSFVLVEDSSLFRRLNFGLDVLPNMHVDLPDYKVVKLLCAPIYILVMAVWFPFLPVIQYAKVFRLQRRLNDSLSSSPTSDELTAMNSQMDRALEEMRRAVTVKSVESYLEAAPQLFLQLFICYKRTSLLHVLPSLVSLLFSGLSLIKTSYELQEVDRLDHAICSPKSLTKYFTTSMLWFFTIISFRSLVISLFCLYLSQVVPVKAVSLVPIFVLFLGNICIRAMVDKGNGAYLYGCTSTVAPSRYVCTKKEESSEKLTKRYLMIYTAFNSLAHFGGLSLVGYFSYTRQMEVLPSHFLLDRATVNTVLIPAISVLGLGSLLTTVIHWKASLLHLFRAEVKFPNFSKLKDRLNSFPSKWRDQGNESSSRASSNAFLLAANGLFHAKGFGSKENALCCFDCGLVIRKWDSHRDINIVHAASLLKYKISYLNNPTCLISGTKANNPDLMRQAFSKFNRVKPECNILKSKRIDFGQTAVRLETFPTYFNVPGGRDEAAQAGFVAVGPMAATCYNCYTLIDWSASDCRMHSPWALHAWNFPTSGCSHLSKHLAKVDVRIRTFPHAWYAMSADPQELARAGFYCSMWKKRGAWITCYACKVHSFHYLTDRRDGAEDDLRSVARKRGQVETPGLSFGYMDKSNRLPPLVHHFLQNINCFFVQEALTSYETRLSTFPPYWSVSATAGVSVQDVARAGFVYYPVLEEFSKKMRPHVGGVKERMTSMTVCPVCLLRVDWMEERRPPRDIRHCELPGKLMSQIKQRFSTLQASDSDSGSEKGGEGEGDGAAAVAEQNADPTLTV